MNHNRRMASRLLTLGIWAVVLASLVFWGLKVFAPRSGVPAGAQMPARALAMGGELRRTLGTSEKPQDDDDDVAETSDRFHLLGVVAPRGAGHSPQGVALIAVGDQPAKAWRAGSVIDGETVLLAVSQRSVQLGPRGGPPTTELTLPDPSTAVNNAPRLPTNAIARPVPMMPQQVPPGQQPGAVQHGPQAQPVQRPATPQQPDEEPEED